MVTEMYELTTARLLRSETFTVEPDSGHLVKKGLVNPWLCRIIQLRRGEVRALTRQCGVKTVTQTIGAKYLKSRLLLVEYWAIPRD